ncbi:unnamed protein product, partial [Rotaria sp. Silwood1]
MNNQAIDMLKEIHEATGLIHKDNQQIHYYGANNEHDDEEEERGEEMDNFSTIGTESDDDMPLLIENQVHFNKRQTIEENLIDDSTSQLPISLLSTGTDPSTSTPITTHHKRPKRFNLSNDHWKQVSTLIPNYKKLSPDQFKDLLVKMISLGDRHKIEQWLTHLTMLQYLQQRAELICTFFQLKIEEHYWNNVANLTTMPIDAYLVKSFYDLNPTQEQITTAQTIWRTKVKSCKRVIRQKKKHHSSIMHSIIMNTMEQQQQQELLSIQSFNASMRTIIQARLLNIEQRAEQLMEFR